MSKNRTLERKRRIRGEAWRASTQLHTDGRQVPRKRRKASKENFLKGSRRKNERVSRCKGSAGGSGEPWFHSKSGQILIGKEVGRQRARSKEDRVR